MQSSNSVNGYYSDSQWNQGMKWAVMAACNQLTNEAYYQKLAKTLLGKQSRAHGILGYAETAPLGPYDYRVAYDLINYLGNNVGILEAWISANLNHIYVTDTTVIHLDDCAALLHNTHKEEKLSDIFGDTILSTSRYDEPDIRWYHANWNNGYSVSLSNMTYQNGPQSEDLREELGSPVILETESGRLVQFYHPMNYNTVTLDEEQIEAYISIALQNSDYSEYEYDDLEFRVFEIEEKPVDVLDNGIEETKTVVGYAVAAFDPMNEDSWEVYKNGNTEEKRLNNSFVVYLDSSGICSVSFNNANTLK